MGCDVGVWVLAMQGVLAAPTPGLHLCLAVSHLREKKNPKVKHCCYWPPRRFLGLSPSNPWVGEGSSVGSRTGWPPKL